MEVHGVHVEESLEERLAEVELLRAGDDVRVEVGGFRAVAQEEDALAVGTLDRGFAFAAPGQGKQQGEARNDDECRELHGRDPARRGTG